MGTGIATMVSCRNEPAAKASPDGAVSSARQEQWLSPFFCEKGAALCKVVVAHANALNRMCALQDRSRLSGSTSWSERQRQVYAIRHMMGASVSLE